MKADERKKLQEAKIRARKAVEEKQAARKVRGEPGEYGFSKESKMDLFCKAISKRPKTMDQIKAEAWNTKNAVFDSRFRQLINQGLAAKTKDGRMYIIGSKADPNNKR